MGAGSAGQRNLLVVGNAPVFRNNCIHRVVSFAGHSLHVARHGPRLNPNAPREGAGPCSMQPAVQRRPTDAIAMLYCGIEYSVVQGIQRHHWKWAATVSGTKISGQGSTRSEAIGSAEKAIERAIQKQRFKQESDGEDQ